MRVIINNSIRRCVRISHFASGRKLLIDGSFAPAQPWGVARGKLDYVKQTTTLLEMVRRIALSLAAAAALPMAAGEARAQNTTDNGTIGSPLLQDFELEGERTTPPAPEPAPPIVAPPSPVSETPVPQPDPSTRAAPERSATAAPRPSVAPPPASDIAEPAPQAVIVPGQPPPGALERELPEPLSPAPEIPAPSTAESALPGGAMVALGLGLIGLLGFLAYRRTARPAAAVEGVALARAPPPTPAPQPSTPLSPAPRPAAAPSGFVGIAGERMRPWIELEFTPERMVATAADATVHFSLRVKNVGRAAARDVLILARMFNASARQKQEIADFLADPSQHHQRGVSIPPQGSAQFRSSVVMPREQARTIMVEGRPLFIPTVAVNVVYQWGTAGKGQTCGSYVVGTESQAPADRMGPFRLDLGPKIYRRVGGRPIDLARAV